MVPIHDKTAVLGSVEAHLRSIGWQSKLTCLGLLVCAGIGTKETRGKRFFIEHRGSLDGYIAYIVVVFIITKCVSRRRPRIHRCMRSGGGRSVVLVVVVEHVSSPYIAEKS